MIALMLFCLPLNLHHLCCSRPPLRGFLMDGDFYVAASLATTLTKVALRYVAIVPDKKRQNVCSPVFTSILQATPLEKQTSQAICPFL